MAARYPNPRRTKLHHNYTVEELAAATGKHKHTIRRWVKEGLPTVDDRRPTMMRGVDVQTFLEARRAKSRQPCGPTEIYCLKCRAPKTPAGLMADLEKRGPTSGRLVAICPDCNRMLYRMVNLGKIEPIKAKMQITTVPTQPRIADSPDPKLNADFKEVVQT